MKTKRTKRPVKFTMRLKSWGSYIDEACRLETILNSKPTRLQIDLVGAGEIPADSALLMRSIILARSPKTRLITNARSSLQGATVLVWLLGEKRMIREDARLYFRAEGPFVPENSRVTHWKDRDFYDDDGLDEENYVRVLHAINEFLPVKELAGRPIELPVLKEFGLVDNETMDDFLAAAFRKESPPEETRRPRTRSKMNKAADT